VNINRYYKYLQENKNLLQVPTAKIPRTIIRDIDAVDGVLRASGTRFAPTEKSSHSVRLEP
jgi:hypothetical protein